MKKLEETVTFENTSIHAFLPHINSLLQNAVLTCTAAMSANQTCPETLKIASNKKIGTSVAIQADNKGTRKKKKKDHLRLVYLV